MVPDAIRPYVVAIQKFHFWMLAALAPLILLPLLFMAKSSISKEIDSQRSKIEGAKGSVEAVFSQNPHPNENWSVEIEARTKNIEKETHAVWEQLWSDQEPLRQWPESLGSDFVAAALSLKPDNDLKRSLLERYQNDIPEIVREIPGRMGADEMMSDLELDDSGGISFEDFGSSLGNSLTEVFIPSLVQWSGTDQQILFSSFKWETTPSTTQVVLAQEELWMYGALCDVIKRVNDIPVSIDASAVVTPANIAIPFVVEMKVGYLAAEEDPGGENSSRLFNPESAGGMFGDDYESEDYSGDDMDMMGVGGAMRPPHPRFDNVGSGSMGYDEGDYEDGMDSGFGGDESSEESLKNWVYVDADGRPLMAEDLGDSSSLQVFRLMPFLLKLRMDQRAIDPLLVELASAPVPIDTRQLRINPEGGSSGMDSDYGGGDYGGSSMGYGGMDDYGDGDDYGMSGSVGMDRPRLHDVNVELRGTLAIIQPMPELEKSEDDLGEDEE